MSKLIPRATIDVIRHMVDVGLDITGIACTLYIPTEQSFLTAEKLDVYSKPADHVFTSYQTNVGIKWSPSVYELKKFGLFVEGQTPIMVQFGFTATALEGSSAGQTVPINVTRYSYFRIEPEFSSGNYQGVAEFQIVNAVTNLHDAALKRVFSAAPRRVKL
jgi:hypothetical protein